MIHKLRYYHILSYIKYVINSIFAGRSAVEHVHHNHTYHMPAESSGSLQRPVSRDKKGNHQDQTDSINSTFIIRYI